MATIQIRDLFFAYPLVNRRRRIGNGVKNEIPVFSNLSLDVRDGTRLAIVGPNGAGKTTLLRLIAGILPPTKGTIRVEGAVSPLLRVRLGMQSELTGRENIWLRGVYMRRTPAEIGERLQQIVEFADLGHFIDLPINTYSTGMIARLAFSIATSFEPEILVIDESIGSGDRQFTSKAAERLRRLVDNSNILVLATHSERLMKEMCNSIFDLTTFEMRDL